MNGQWPHDFQRHTAELMAAEQGNVPSGADVVDAFVECLRASSPAEREMMAAYLREIACILCGNPDPDCECFLKEEAVPS